jgi:hypothetical protein
MNFGHRTLAVASVAACCSIVGSADALATPPGVVPLRARDGVAIERGTVWAAEVARETFVDLARELRLRDTLSKHRWRLPTADLDAVRDGIRQRITTDRRILQRAQRILATLAVLRADWFDSFARDATSPILGPSRLTAKQMADFVRLRGTRVRTSVPITELARMYLQEGDREGVRGDVAFAQAIKETGEFSSPDVTINNFAGLGHCSACAHGDAFRTAREGVRAQIQLLRWYADPTVRTLADLTSQPATLPTGFLHLRHDALTWDSLGGRWAPNPAYGQSVYALYLRMCASAEPSLAGADRSLS